MAADYNGSGPRVNVPGIVMRHNRGAVVRQDGRMVAQVIALTRAQPVASAAAAIAAIGIATLCGAWFFQYVIGLPPCPMCLEQRYAYYISIPLAAMVMLGTTVGASHKVTLLAFLAVAVAMLWNAGLGVFHSGVEW